MSLFIRNEYTTGVWVSVMWSHPNCSDGGNWEKAGWWRFEPGQSGPVLNGDIGDLNRYVCFNAQADDGRFWAGEFVRPAPDRAFDWCEWTGSTDSNNIGYRLQDVGDNDDFTIRLVSS
jgi:hypothetical protein